MTDPTNAELLEKILQPHPTISTTLWKFQTVPIYGKTRLDILALVLKTFGALKTYEFQYSDEPTIFVQGHTAPMTFDSPTRLWETLTALYKQFTGGSKVIEVKSELKYFNLTKEGFKLNELRKNDRDYQIGDYVIMAVVDKMNGYTGQAIGGRINWLVAGEEAERWMLPGHCNFGLSEIIVMDLETTFP